MSIVTGWRNIYQAPGELDTLQGRFAQAVETYVIAGDTAVRNELRPLINQNASEIASLRSEVAELRSLLDEFNSIFSLNN